MFHLLILLVIIEWQNRHTVPNIEGETEAAVVDDKHFLGRSVFDYPEVFDVAVLGADAVLSIETVLEVLAVRVKKVQNGIRVSLLTSSKGDYLEVLCELVQARLEMWSHVEPNILRVRRVVEIGYLDFVLTCHTGRVTLVDGVDHGLINV